MSELDRILESEEWIEPSSGLTGAVMDAVREEARMLRPVPFPWKRIAPGFAACLVLLVSAFVLAAVQGIPAAGPEWSPEQAELWLREIAGSSWGLVGLGLLVSLLAWRVPLCLAARLG